MFQNNLIYTSQKREKLYQSGRHFEHVLITQNKNNQNDNIN